MCSAACRFPYIPKPSVRINIQRKILALHITKRRYTFIPFCTTAVVLAPCPLAANVRPQVMPCTNPSDACIPVREWMEELVWQCGYHFSLKNPDLFTRTNSDCCSPAGFGGDASRAVANESMGCLSQPTWKTLFHVAALLTVPSANMGCRSTERLFTSNTKPVQSS